LELMKRLRILREESSKKGALSSNGPETPPSIPVLGVPKVNRLTRGGRETHKKLVRRTGGPNTALIWTSPRGVSYWC